MTGVQTCALPICSTFSFVAEFGIAENQTSQRPAQIQQLRDLPVLVVDDNSTNRRILQELLRNWGLQPTLVDNGRSALAAIQEAQRAGHPFRLGLLDFHMPEMDGLQLAERVSSLPDRPRMPMLMLSSSLTTFDSERLREVGIRRFLRKPVLGRELLEAILQEFGVELAVKAAQHQGQFLRLAPRRILLAEDSLVSQKVAVGFLTKWGHEVVLAPHGQAALELWRRESFDLILMDMQMPEMNGHDATAAIRREERGTGRRIPIVAMTAEAMIGDREHCLVSGMDDYVSKPITPAELYRVVECFPAVCLASSHPDERREGEAPAEPRVSPETLSLPTPDTRPVIDWSVAKQQFGAGAEVMREFVAMLKSQIPQLMQDMHQSLETRDSKLLRRAAHTLRGSVISFGAAPLAEAALALENLGRAESFDGFSDLLETLDRELARALAELDAGPPESDV